MIATLTLSACGDVPAIVPEFEFEPKQERALFDLQTALANLEKRRSYASKFRVDWEGPDNGEPMTSRLDLEQVQVKPDRREIYATVHNEKLETRHIINFIQIKNQTWFYHQGWGDTWQEMPTGDLETLTDETFFTPEIFLKRFSVQVDEPTQPEPAKENGILAYRYNFDENDLSAEGMEVNEANGYAYVSAEGGDLITFYLNAEVAYTLPDDITESGQMNVRFEVVQMQPDIVIAPPQTTRTDIPLPDDVTLPDPTPIPFSRRAAQTPTTNNEIRFETTAGVPETARLYQTEMPQHGWEAFSYDIPFDSTDTARLRYIKDNEGVEITVIDEEDGASVRLMFKSATHFQDDVCGSFRCGIPAMVNFPVAPDANGITFISGMGAEDRLQYQTSAGMEETANFYTTTMPADGWTEADLADYTLDPNEIVLVYVKNNEPVVIYINNAYEVTQVMITENPSALTIHAYPDLEDLQMMHEFPIMPQPQINRLLPGQLTYQTPENIDAVAQFYQTELEDKGWSLRPGGIQNSETFIMRYKKVDTTATVMIKKTGTEKSMVWVTLQRNR